jgi:hypothetical protein
MKIFGTSTSHPLSATQRVQALCGCNPASASISGYNHCEVASQRVQGIVGLQGSMYNKCVVAAQHV